MAPDDFGLPQAQSQTKDNIVTPRYSMAGRTALISGASSGIGAHLARLFGTAGAKVILGARRTDMTEDLTDEIKASGGTALAVPMDVTD